MATFFVGTGSFLMLGVRVGALTGARHAGTALRSFITSANPCLVIGARNAALGGEPAAQGTEQPILLRIAEADIGQCCEVDRGARDSERTLSRARDIATLSRCSGIAVSVPPMKQWVHEPLGAVGEGGVDIIFS